MVKNMRRKFRRLVHNKEGGVATYVLIMFGMVFILYLFGFTNMWDAYQTQSVNSSNPNETISNTNEGFGFSVLDMLTGFFTNSANWLLVAGGAAGLVVLFIFGKLTNTLGVILTYLVPVLLLVALNIFVFPLNSMSAEVGFMDAGGAILSGGLFAFFNIFFILAVIEFIRGSV